ncbi:MAG: hypothetical protein Q8N00_04370 [Nitrospirota bacterium]|nr:hypothetical protein [Nitrospirota bacterium]MDP3598805.1 hypothetical protein [Nitrospirota bacterium]
MRSDYLTANFICVAVIGLILSRESLALSFAVLIQHRQWWAQRAIRFPLFFGSVYTVLNA